MLVRELAGLVAGSAKNRWRSGCRKLFLCGLPETQAGGRSSGKDRLIRFPAPGLCRTTD